MLFKLSRYDHLTFYYTEVHWLPINERINFKILLLIYKSINGHSPSYLKDLFSPYVPRRDLRSADGMLLTKPKMLTSIGERAISYQGPLLWNGLPDYIKQANSIDNFKKKLKTFYFRSAIVSINHSIILLVLYSLLYFVLFYCLNYIFLFHCMLLLVWSFLLFYCIVFYCFSLMFYIFLIALRDCNM